MVPHGYQIDFLLGLLMLYSFSIQFLIFVVMLPLGGLVFSLSIFNLCGFDFGVTFVLDIVSVMFFSCVLYGIVCCILLFDILHKWGSDFPSVFPSGWIICIFYRIVSIFWEPGFVNNWVRWTRTGVLLFGSLL